MKEEKQIYVYKSIYKHYSWQESLNQLINSFHKETIKLYANFKLTTKSKEIKDSLSYRENLQSIHSHHKAFNTPEPQIFQCTNFFIDSIHFFEVLEIDEFEKFEKKLLHLFKSHKRGLSGKKLYTSIDLKKTKKTLSSIKNSFDTVLTGELFSIPFNEPNNKYSYIGHLKFSYIKTDESYFIINIEIMPSMKYKSILKLIVDSDDAIIHFPHFNNLFSVLKGRYYEKYSDIDFSKKRNFEYLRKDMNFQIQSFIKENFKGLFLSSKYSSYLPSLEKYSVNDISLLKKDTHLYGCFSRDSEEIFYDDSEKTQLIFPRLEREAKRVKNITLIKESQNNIKSKDSNIEFINYSEFITSITTPWTLVNILHIYWYHIATLKRKVYDFIKVNSKRNFLHKIYRIFNTRKLIQLKYDLAKYRVLFKRFENEFNPENLRIYTLHSDLKKFKTTRINEKQTDLLNYLFTSVKYPITNLEKEIKQINENFVTVEEINSFRTNYFLQYFSLLIGLVAFIFTFDKAKNLFERLVEFIKCYF